MKYVYYLMPTLPLSLEDWQLEVLFFKGTICFLYPKRLHVFFFFFFKDYIYILLLYLNEFFNV